MTLKIFQGYSLIKSKAGDNEIYGWVTIGMNWLPGLVAATHIVSMYRKTISAKRTLTVASNKYFFLFFQLILSFELHTNCIDFKK